MSRPTDRRGSRATDRRGRRDDFEPDEPAPPRRAGRTTRADDPERTGRSGRADDPGYSGDPGRTRRTARPDPAESGVGRVSRITDDAGRARRTARADAAESGIGRIERVTVDLGRAAQHSRTEDVERAGTRRSGTGPADGRRAGAGPADGRWAGTGADEDGWSEDGWADAADEGADPDAPTPPHGMPAVVPPVTPPVIPPRVAPVVVARESDRVWVHFVWEALLLAAVAGAVVTLSLLGAEAFSGRSLDFLLVQAAGIGLVATGLAYSLRAAVPNLAVGAIAASAATIAGWVVAEDVSFTLAALVVLTGAMLVGLGLAVVVVGLQVPAWAASLGVALLVVALATAMDGRQGRPVRGAGVVTDWPWVWFGVFVLVSVAGGAVCAMPEVRRWLGGMRGDRDPARRPNGGAAAGAALALIGSTVLAAAGGLVLSAMPGYAEPANPLGVLPTALAAVLLGGVSAFGRRAGVFGTVLGVLLVLLVLRITTHLELNVRDAVLGAAVVLGLVVNRALEATGRRTAGR